MELAKHEFPLEENNSYSQRLIDVLSEITIPLDSFVCFLNRVDHDNNVRELIDILEPLVVKARLDIDDLARIIEKELGVIEISRRGSSKDLITGVQFVPKHMAQSR